ncbi:2-oxoglutarate dehydrogenase complex dihydrolipoyllysine-residue succinyltransferase [Anaplasmataceae bacterium AB001_6]|nr:2-oxoglutarate dehydrogenase complex dihydrolipoyllysine-residue succinyltransferase [Anaplasmataceae bacterium AB001_6]
MNKINKIIVPDLGESISQGSISSITKQKGEYIEADELFATIETDKVAVEINSPFNGVIKSIAVNNNDVVDVGAVIAEIEETSDKPQVDPNQIIEISDSSKKEIPSSPAAEKIANNMNIDISKISGSGKNSIVTKEDVLSTIDQQKINSVIDTSGNSQKSIENNVSQNIQNNKLSERETAVNMSNIRLAIAKNLKNSQNNAVMLSTFSEVNMDNVMKIRSMYKDDFAKKHGVKLGFMSFFVKASIKALQDIPEINAEIRGNNIIYKNYCNIGVAVSTDKGLVVPVLKDAQNMSFADIEKQIIEFAKAAKSNTLKVSDMSGGTFTITNGGIFGSLLSTPIINPPQSGILGMHSITNRAIVGKNNEIIVAPMMYLALSYDHRIVDGKGAVTFLQNIKRYIEDPCSLLIDV